MILIKRSDGEYLNLSAAVNLSNHKEGLGALYADSGNVALVHNLTVEQLALESQHPRDAGVRIIERHWEIITLSLFNLRDGD